MPKLLLLEMSTGDFYDEYHEEGLCRDSPFLTFIYFTFYTLILLPSIFLLYHIFIFSLSSLLLFFLPFPFSHLYTLHIIYIFLFILFILIYFNSLIFIILSFYIITFFISFSFTFHFLIL